MVTSPVGEWGCQTFCDPCTIGACAGTLIPSIYNVHECEYTLWVYYISGPALLKFLIIEKLSILTKFTIPFLLLGLNEFDEVAGNFV